MDTQFIDAVGLFAMIAGFVIGLGSVIVIDIHGFLGRKSHYWTEATTRTHKVTKPMIWFGIFLLTIGALVVYRSNYFNGIPFYHFLITLALIANGFFLSFKVSPYMLNREKEGRQAELFPKEWQAKIALGLIVSDLGWWSLIGMFVYYLAYLRT